MTTPATTPADGELLQRIAENDPSWVLKYLEQNTRFDVPRIRELFEFAKAQATAMLATPSPGKADAEIEGARKVMAALEAEAKKKREKYGSSIYSARDVDPEVYDLARGILERDKQ